MIKTSKNVERWQQRPKLKSGNEKDVSGVKHIKLKEHTQVVGKLEYDAKAAGRSVQIVLHRKVTSQKSKKDADAKLIYMKKAGDY